MGFLAILMQVCDAKSSFVAEKILTLGQLDAFMCTLFVSFSDHGVD